MQLEQALEGKRAAEERAAAADAARQQEAAAHAAQKAKLHDDMDSLTGQLASAQSEAHILIPSAQLYVLP